MPIIIKLDQHNYILIMPHPHVVSQVLILTLNPTLYPRRDTATMVFLPQVQRSCKGLSWRTIVLSYLGNCKGLP